MEACPTLWFIVQARDIKFSAEKQISLLQGRQNKNPKLHISTPLAFFNAQICLYAKADTFGPFLINVLKEHI